MSGTNPRRHGVLGFSEYAGALAKKLSALQAFYQSPAREQEAEYAHAKRDSLFAQILHDLAPHKQDLVFIGGNFDKARAWRGCKGGTPMLRNLLEYIERHRITIYVDEYLSSKKCRKCKGWLTQVSPREKMCNSSDCSGAVVNRDDNAQANLQLCVEMWLDGQDRPSYLERPPSKPKA